MNSSTSFPVSRRGLLLCAAALASPLVAPLAHAESVYPAKPVTLLVPYPAGGANDAVARLIGLKMGENLKQPVVIDNRPGAGTTIGTALAAKAQADGYTLVLGSLASHAVSPHLYARPGYDAVADFAPVGMIGVVPLVLVVAQDSPYTNLKSLVEAARKQPGLLNYGSSGNGSPLHLGAELFKQRAQLQINHVPYKGGNAHTMDLMGGRLDMIMDTLTSASPLLKSGKVRALAVASASRLPELQNVPTFAEAGYPGFEAMVWFGLFAPPRMAPALTDRLGRELIAVVRGRKTSDFLIAQGAMPSGIEPAEFARVIRDETVKWHRVTVAAGVQPE